MAGKTDSWQLIYKVEAGNSAPIPLDGDFDQGCFSKGDIPRRGETPNLYRPRNYDESVNSRRTQAPSANSFAGAVAYAHLFPGSIPQVRKDFSHYSRP